MKHTTNEYVETIRDRFDQRHRSMSCLLVLNDRGDLKFISVMQFDYSARISTFMQWQNIFQWTEDLF